MKYLLSTCLGILLFLIPSASKSQGFRLPTPVHDAGTSNNELHEMVVYDREGNSHLLSEISFYIKISTKNQGIAPTCNAGIFRLHFDDAGTNTGFDDAVAGAQRAAVACQVFTDISNLIHEAQSPYSSITNLGSGNSYVEIQVQTSLNSSTNPTLGMAGQYFLTTSPGIVHGSVWQTINSGMDTWFAINASNLGTVGIYHGLLQINFGHNFYTGTATSGIGATQSDLYSVILHEAIHALGFGSLIDQNGKSKLTNTNPGIYSFYDTYLTDVSGNKLINTTNCYTSTFNTIDLPKLTTSCAIKLNGTNPVFVVSDAIWSNGTSLSHYPAACGNTGNYVMKPSMATGTTKRFPDIAELTALCDLGYSTSGIYPGTTYPSSGICGSRVAGVNDYAPFTTTAPGIAYSTPSNTAFTFNSTDFLGNDENATYYACLEVVNLSGTLIGSLNGGIGSSITFTPNNNFAGTAILKYIPKASASGKSGNITYIFITVLAPPPPPCVLTNPCEMVCYGGFEEFATQAQYDLYTLGGFTSNNVVSFNIYPATYADNSPDLRTSGFYTGSGILNCGGPNTQINAHGGNQFIGMILRNTPSTLMNNPEGPCIPLNTPVNPGESVTVKLWALLADQACMGGVEARLVNMAPCTGSGGVLLSACPGLVQTSVVASGQLINNNNWQQMTMTIANSTSSPMTHLIINSLPYTPYVTTPFGFIYVDDISCIKNVPTLTLTKTGPSMACNGDTVLYTITITNSGTSLATNIQLKDTLGQGLNYTPGGTFNFPTQTLSSLAVGASQTYTLKSVVTGNFGNAINYIKVISGACLTSSSNTIASLEIKIKP